MVADNPQSLAPRTVDSGMPRIELRVNAAGFGILAIDGVEISASNVRVEVEPGRGSMVRFEMLAEISCEIAPGGNAIEVRELKR